jgi:hypothetical protein
VATPRGAEVWMLVGGSPETQVVEQTCDDDVEILVAGPTTLRKRMHVGAGDFTSGDPLAASGPPPRIPSRVAHVSAK